jgi:hypothetical protein
MSSLAAGGGHLFRKPLKPLQIGETLVDAQFEALSEERAIDVLFVGFDDRIGRELHGRIVPLRRDLVSAPSRSDS